MQVYQEPSRLRMPTAPFPGTFFPLEAHNAKATPTLRVTGLGAGNSPASNAEDVSV